MALLFSSRNGPVGVVHDLVSPQGKVQAIIVDGAQSSSDITNASEVPGATLTDALNELAPDTLSEPGFLARYVYINAADPDVGSACAAYPGLVFLAAFNLTTAADIWPGNEFEVVCWGSGAAGAFGLQQTLVSDSAAGEMSSAGGARIAKRFTRSELVAALSIAMTIPARTASTVPPTTGSVAGTGESPSPSGAMCLFGNLVAAGGGGGGTSSSAAATQAGGAGGGEGENGGAGTTAATRGGAATAASLRGSATFGAGLALGNTATKTNGLPSLAGGSSGGRGGNQLVAGGDGGQASSGGGGSGAGGGTGAPASGPNAQAGAGGSSGVVDNPTSGGGGAGGTPGTGTVDGGNGQPGADQTRHTNSGSGGGAGGGCPRLNGRGGDGGPGGNPGGAGGPGGLGRGADGVQRRGRAGPGGRAQIVVTAFA